MDCRDVLQALHDAHDGCPAAVPSDALHAHLTSCAACAEAERQLRAMRAAFRATPQVAAPATFAAEVEARLPARGGRLLTLPRLLVPVAAAAALLVAAYLAAPRVEREVARSDGPAVGTARAFDANVPESRKPALDAETALESARRLRGRADEAEAKAETPAEEAEPGATAGAAPPAAPAPAPDGPADFRRALEKEADVPAPSEAEDGERFGAPESGPAGAKVETFVVFRSEADARAFLADLETAARRAAGGGDRKDDEAGVAPAREATKSAGPPAAGGGAPGGASAGPTAGGRGGVGRAGPSGGKTPGTEPEDAAAQSAAVDRRAAPAVRLLAFAVARDPAWVALADARGGAVVTLSETTLADEARSTPADRYRALLRDPPRSDGRENGRPVPTPLPDPGVADAGAGAAARSREPPRPVPEPAPSATPQPPAEAETVLIVLVDESLPPPASEAR